MKKKAVYLGYPPGIELKSEGLGRLLALILKASNEKWVIYTLQSSVSSIQKLFDDYGIERNCYEFQTAQEPAFVQKFYVFCLSFYQKIKKSRLNKRLIKDKNASERHLKKEAFKGKSKYIVKTRILPCVDKLFNFCLYIALKNNLFFILIVFIGLLLTGLMLPIILFLFVLAVFIYIFNRGLMALKALIIRRVEKLRNLFITNYMLKVGTALFFRYLFVFYEKYRIFFAKEVIKKINQAKDVDSVFIPTLFWEEVLSINKRRIIVVPDVVFWEFPDLYQAHYFEDKIKIINNLLSSNSFFITYSKYVKESVLRKRYQVSNDRICIIKHGNNIKTTKNAEYYSYILKKYLYTKEDSYLKNIDFQHTKYIIYTSQYRPHKNILNLVKAYEYLLRRKYIKFKLVLTCALIEDVKDYIHEQALELDVLSLRLLPNDVLDALNYFATCSVNPTLFEGGFPFTFSEAFSMGTPSIMSNIPVVKEEIVDTELAELMLFDPYNIIDMANKIEWGIKNNAELMLKQQSLYDRFKLRTWEKVALEYCECIDGVSRE